MGVWRKYWHVVQSHFSLNGSTRTEAADTHTALPTARLQVGEQDGQRPRKVTHAVLQVESSDSTCLAQGRRMEEGKPHPPAPVGDVATS